jgi:hypothetical protein
MPDRVLLLIVRLRTFGSYFHLLSDHSRFMILYFLVQQSSAHIYTPLRSETQEIRLFDLDPWTATSSDPVELRMVTTELGDEGEFVCLSYNWGEPVPKYGININGSDFEIRNNLHAALLRLSRQRPLAQTLGRRHLHTLGILDILDILDITIPYCCDSDSTSDRYRSRLSRILDLFALT